MIENSHNYVFDFEKEVEDLRRILGAKADNFLFIHVDIERVEGAEPNVTLPHVIAGKGVRQEDIKRYTQWEIRDYTEEPDKSSHHWPILDFGIDEKDPPTIGHAITLKSHEDSWNVVVQNNSFMQLFALYHETAHALLSDHPEIDGDHPQGECAADAYAALRCLQKFGKEAIPVLSMISWDRTFGAICGDTSHLTTTVIDKIIADSMYEDFSELSHDDLLARAEVYAKEWTPQVDVLFSTREALSAGGDEISLSALYKTCLSEPPNAFAFYIGAKFFQPFLHPDGVDLGGELMTIEADRRQEYADTIAAYAGEVGLSGIFNDHSMAVMPMPMHPLEAFNAPVGIGQGYELPVVETLKVARPMAQPFAIKF